MGTHADIDGVHCFSLVRLAEVLRDTSLSIKEAFAAVTWKRGWTTLSFGFTIIGAEILQTSWAVILIIATTVLSLVAIGFKTPSAEIAGTKIAGETGDDIIMLLIVEEH